MTFSSDVSSKYIINNIDMIEPVCTSLSDIPVWSTLRREKHIMEGNFLKLLFMMLEKRGIMLLI